MELARSRSVGIQQQELGGQLNLCPQGFFLPHPDAEGAVLTQQGQDQACPPHPEHQPQSRD